MAIGRDDELATAVVRNVILFAECVQAIGSFDAQLGLHRAGRIVDACVDDAAVVRGRFLTESSMPLRQYDGKPAIGELVRRGEAGDAAADNQGVN